MPSPDITTTGSPYTTDVNTDEESGLEVEQDDQADNITNPFDPEKIKVRTVNIVIDQLVTRIKHKEIDLTPEFQRLRGIWNRERKSRLIESLLLRIPIPVFYVAGQENDDWSVVDGLQRMSTIYDFVNGEFALERLEYLLDFNGLKLDGLPRPMQRRIGETQLIVNVIEPGTPPEVMFNIFLRINTGGMTLNGQEIRHALHAGPVREFLKELSQSDEFLKATNRSVKPVRMADRECVLRFLAFHITPPEEYSVNDLDRHLSTTMKIINSITGEERDALANSFKKAMIAAYDIFGDDAFRKRTNKHDSKRPVSRALFEVWSVHLARHSPEQIRSIVDQREDIQKRLIQLMNVDRDFDRAISYSTGVPQRVHKRFSAIGQLLEGLV